MSKGVRAHRRRPFARVAPLWRAHRGLGGWPLRAVGVLASGSQIAISRDLIETSTAHTACGRVSRSSEPRTGARPAKPDAPGHEVTASTSWLRASKAGGCTPHVARVLDEQASSDAVFTRDAACQRFGRHAVAACIGCAVAASNTDVTIRVCASALRLVGARRLRRGVQFGDLCPVARDGLPYVRPASCV